ncbi:relaxase/mobilization nuclease domain-containing protein [Ruminococcus flavefaciens]|uniref:Relaxase/Mobilisation nuclease domain-containing protein n=1 Tax=Ruminococcus flavefaciens TaxID=1265 RepID=A0A1K1NBW0_RUMFL|nr:relaxase/mobilization nuclease domain-containing protein [Ruminococcus flavefaciens]SFW32847.1 Relaxase/Mobilisation nuclease domain-containing protein [Ruminococcus flavefaciens]
MFGNVNADYKPCKSQIQLDRASRYMLGELPEQQQAGVIKTAPHLCWEMNCDRNIYSCDILTTRKLFGKRDNKRTNLAFKMSLSFSPDDNDKLTYEEVFNIAKEFAEKFFDGYQVMFAVHTDKPHKHVHFLVGNCHIETGKAYRRSQKDLQTMCEFFGEQCMKRGLTNSVRKDYYNDDPDRDKETFAEKQMKAKGKETFKDELRKVIRIECADPNNRTLEDVVNALMKHYHVECCVKGNTISYRHPNYTDKRGKLVSVRGSKLGDKYTVKGINYELGKIRRGQEADRAEALTADTTKTADRTQTANGVLHTGTDDKRSGAYPQGVRTLEQSTETGGKTNGNQETGGAFAGTGRNRNESSGNGGGDRSIIGGRSEGREGSPSGNGNAKDVPTFEELFDSYKRRNTKVVRTSDAEPEPARAVRKKRQDRGL